MHLDFYSCCLPWISIEFAIKLRRIAVHCIALIMITKNSYRIFLFFPFMVIRKERKEKEKIIIRNIKTIILMNFYCDLMLFDAMRCDAMRNNLSSSIKIFIISIIAYNYYKSKSLSKINYIIRWWYGVVWCSRVMRHKLGSA